MRLYIYFCNGFYRKINLVLVLVIDCIERGDEMEIS